MVRTDESVEMLPAENLSADPLISKIGQRAGAERGPLRVDPATDLEHRPAPEVYTPLDAAEHGAREASMGNPGRYSDAELFNKPGARTTPYRSRMFVSGRHTADGNGYGVGEPISEAEARRQAEEVYGERFVPIVQEVTVVSGPSVQADQSGVVIAPSVTMHVDTPETYLAPTTGERITEEPLGVRHPCPKCETHGKSPKMVAKHGPAIGHCPACRPCSECGGRGYLDEPDETEEVT